MGGKYQLASYKFTIRVHLEWIKHFLKLINVAQLNWIMKETTLVKKVGRYDGVFPCDVETLLTCVQQKLISGYHTPLVVYVACLHPFRPLLEKKKTLSSFFFFFCHLFFVNSMDHIPLSTDKEPTGLLRSPLFEELVVHTR